MEGIRIPLDAHSLYISTIPLVGVAFHWSLIHVDGSGTPTRHHWATITRDIHGPEAYVENALPYGARSVTGKNSILGYFKLSDYKPMDVSMLRDVCRQIFPVAYPTVDENRLNGITCRTWIIQILSKILSETRAQEVEELVKKLSVKESNEYANCFLWRRPFMCIVENI